MAGLSDCLKRIKLDAHEAAIVRGYVDENKGEGYEAHQAAVNAVKQYQAELDAERDDIVAQVRKLFPDFDGAETKAAEPETRAPESETAIETQPKPRKEYPPPGNWKDVQSVRWEVGGQLATWGKSGTGRLANVEYVSPERLLDRLSQLVGNARADEIYPALMAEEGPIRVWSKTPKAAVPAEPAAPMPETPEPTEPANPEMARLQAEMDDALAQLGEIFMEAGVFTKKAVDLPETWPAERPRTGLRKRVHYLDAAWQWRGEGQPAPFFSINEATIRADRTRFDRVRALAERQTADQVRAELRESFGHVFDRLEARGLVEIVRAPAGTPPGTSAVFDGGRATLYWDRIPPGQAVGKFLHEAGVHGSLDWGRFVRDYRRLLAEGDPLALRVEAHIAVLDRNGRLPKAHADQERIAYLVEYITNLDEDARRTIPGRIRVFVQRVIAAVRAALAASPFGAWLEEHGFRLTARDIAAMTRAAIKARAAAAARVQAQMQGFDTTQVWFHGTPADNDIEGFDVALTGSKTGTDEEAVYLTDNPDVAAAYAWSEEIVLEGDEAHTQESGGAIYPVYIKGRLYDARAEVGDRYRRETFQKILARARKEGYDGVDFGEIYDVPGGTPYGTPKGRVVALFDPSHIRSTFAEFNPLRADTATLLASDRPTAETKPVWYSALARAFEGAKQATMPADQWAKWLTGNAAKLGVKQDEIQWSGVLDWLQAQGSAKLAREAIGAYLRQGGVKVLETVKGYRPPFVMPEFEVEENEYDYAARDTRGRQLAAVGKGVVDNLEEARGYLAVVIRRKATEEYADQAQDARSSYDEYTLKGGTNYRELLLTLPQAEPDFSVDDFIDSMAKKYGKDALYDKEGPIATIKADFPAMLSEQDQAAYRAIVAAKKPAARPYASPHWQDRNVLVHVRFNERTDDQGRRVLFVEEIQSDWGQEGKRKGFDTGEAAPAGWAETGNARSTGNIPSAPFVTDTKAWTALALKRVIRWAAEHDFDAVAFINGEQQAARYDLSKHISRLELTDNSSGGIGTPRMDGPFGYGTLLARDLNNRPVINHEPVHGPDDLASLIGKEMAERLLAAEPVAIRSAGVGLRLRQLVGLDLKVGGEGMKGYYDRILPQVARDLVKKLGGTDLAPVHIDVGGYMDTDAEVDENGVPVDEHPVWRAVTQYSTQLGIEITPQLRRSAMAGLPLFSVNEDRFSPTGGTDLAPARRSRIRGYLDELDEKSRQQQLAFLTRDQLAVVSHDLLPEIEDRYLRIARHADGTRNEVHNKLGEFAQPWGKLSRETPAEAAKLATVMHESTIAGVDGSKAYASVIDIKQGLEEIRKIQVAAAVNKNLTPQDIGDMNRIKALIRQEMTRRGEYARIKALYDDLTSTAQEIYNQARDFHEWVSAEIFNTLMQRISDIDAPQRVKRELQAKLRLEFEQNKVTAPYFPLSRFGKYWVHYREPSKTVMDYPLRIEKFAEDSFLVGGRSAAMYADLLKKAGGRYIKGVGRVYKAKDEAKVRQILGDLLTQKIAHEEPGDRYVEMLETEAEWTSYMDELERAGMEILSKGTQFNTFRDIDGVSPQFVADVEERIAALGNSPVVAELRDDIWQLYLKSMPDLSVRKHLIHRTKRPGYSDDALKANVSKGFHDGYQLSRLKHVPHLQRVIEDLRENVVTAGNPGRRAKLRAELEQLQEYQALRGRIDLDGIDRKLADLHQQRDGGDRSKELFALIARWEQFRNWFRQGHNPAPRIQRIEEQLAAATRIARKGDAGIAQATRYVNELQDFHSLLLNPEGTAIATLFNQIGFIWFLGASTAGGLVNGLQTPVIAMPAAAARFGMGKTTAAFSRAFRDFWTSPKLTMGNRLQGEELKAFLEFQRLGIIDKTLSHDLAGVAEQGISYTGNRYRVMKAVSWFFHHTERFNREVTTMAIYRLARAAGESEHDAFWTAVTLVDRTHGNYEAVNRARFMRGTGGRVFMQFKQYPQFTTFLLLRAFRDAFRGSSPEQKAEARKMLASILAMQAMVAGVHGLPWLVSLAGAPAAVFGRKGAAATAVAGALLYLATKALEDPDDPEDWEAKMRTALAEAGKSIAEAAGMQGETAAKMGSRAEAVLWNGVLDSLLGWAVSSRASMTELWMRLPDKDLEGNEGALWVLETVLGPMVGILKNAAVGASMVDDGLSEHNPQKIARGIEHASPNVLKYLQKAYHMIAEGGKATTMGGKELVTDLSPWEMVGQGIGFMPTRVKERYDMNAAVRNVDQQITGRRHDVLARYAGAIEQNNQEPSPATEKELDSALEAWMRFNVKNPERAITGSDLRQSIVGRGKREANTEGGLYLAPRSALLRGRYRFGGM